MVEKTEGATMTCKNCGTLLTCHEKIYPETDKFKERKVMQWQNDDGTAHYSTKDGKNFSCNIPDGQHEEQANNTLNQYQQEQRESLGNGQTNIGLATISKQLDKTNELLAGIFQQLVDMNLKTKEEK